MKIAYRLLAVRTLDEVTFHLVALRRAELFADVPSQPWGVTRAGLVGRGLDMFGEIGGGKRLTRPMGERGGGIRRQTQLLTDLCR